MSLASLEQAIPEGERTLVDASTLIAFFNGLEQASPLAEHVIESMVRPGRNPAVVSTVTAMEVLVQPLRRGVGDPYRHLVDFLTRFPNLTAAQIDLAVAQEAASLRAAYGFATPDALVIATGIVGQVGHLVTNDRQWKRKLQPISRRIRVCYLADHLPFP